MSCVCHSLNLVLSYMAHSCAKVISIFGILQHINALFSGSTKRWKILLDHVPSCYNEIFMQYSLGESNQKCQRNQISSSKNKVGLLELYESCDDALTKSDDESLIM